MTSEGNKVGGEINDINDTHRRWTQPGPAKVGSNDNNRDSALRKVGDKGQGRGREKKEKRSKDQNKEREWKDNDLAPAQGRESATATDTGKRTDTRCSENGRSSW